VINAIKEINRLTALVIRAYATHKQICWLCHDLLPSASATIQYNTKTDNVPYVT